MKWLKGRWMLVLLAVIAAAVAIFAVPAFQRWRAGTSGALPPRVTPANEAVYFQYRFAPDRETAFTQTTAMAVQVRGAQVPHAINSKDPAAGQLRQFALMAKSRAQMIFTTDMAYRQRIMGVDASGNASIHGIIDDMFITSSINGRRAAAPDNAEYKGKTYSMTMSPQGKISNYTTSFDAGTGASAGAGELQKSMNQITAVFPDRPVKPGESWDKDIIPDPVPGATYDAIIRNHYTFTGLERLNDGRTCARVDVKIHMEQKSIVHAKGVTITTTASGAGTGVIDFDVAAGQIAKNKLNLAYDATVKVQSLQRSIPGARGAAGRDGGQTGQITTTNTIDMVTEAK